MIAWIEKFLEDGRWCSEAGEWLDESDFATPDRAWQACERADWMIFVLWEFEVISTGEADALAESLEHTAAERGHGVPTFPWNTSRLPRSVFTGNADRLREKYPTFPVDRTGEFTSWADVD
jgi:hypothetical protein